MIEIMRKFSLITEHHTQSSIQSSQNMGDRIILYYSQPSLLSFFINCKTWHDLKCEPDCVFRTIKGLENVL